MNGNEPLLLYPGTKSSYTMLSWPESGSRSYFFALGSEDGRQDFSRKVRRSADKAGTVERQLEKAGGILVSVDGEPGHSYRLAFKAWALGSYVPPEQILVFGPGEKVGVHPVREPNLVLGPAQYVLVPVDRGSEEELKATLGNLQGLPADMRSAMWRALTGQAVSPAERAISTPGETAAQRSTAWVWIVLAAIFGLLAGGLRATLATPHISRRWRTQTGKRPVTTRLSTRRWAALVKAIPNSPDDRVSALNAMYLEPLEGEGPKSPSRETAEAWMLLKLLLYKNDPQTDTTWTKTGNDAAIARISETKAPAGTSLQVEPKPTAGPKPIDDADRNAVNAVACLQVPPVSFAEKADCAKVDWEKAAAGLQGLTIYVGKQPKAENPSADAQGQGTETPVEQQANPAQTGGAAAAKQAAQVADQAAQKAKQNGSAGGQAPADTSQAKPKHKKMGEPSAGAGDPNHPEQ